MQNRNSNNKNRNEDSKKLSDDAKANSAHLSVQCYWEWINTLKEITWPQEWHNSDFFVVRRAYDWNMDHM